MWSQKRKSNYIIRILGFRSSTEQLYSFCSCSVWHFPAFPPADILLFYCKSVHIPAKYPFPIKLIYFNPKTKREKEQHCYYQVIQHSLCSYSLLISMQWSWCKLKPQIQLKVNEARLAITIGLWECFAPRLQPHSIIMLCIMLLSKRENKEWIAESFMVSSASCLPTPSSPPQITHSVALFDIKAQWKK